MNTTAMKLNTMYRTGKLGKLLLFAIIAIGFVYLFLLVSTTVNIAERKHAEKTTKEIQSEIAQMEIDYFAQSNNLNIDYARENGFVESDTMYFAYEEERTEVAVATE